MDKRCFWIQILKGGLMWKQMFFSHPTLTAKHSTMHKNFHEIKWSVGMGEELFSGVLVGAICEVLILVVCPLWRSYNIDMVCRHNVDRQNIEQTKCRQTKYRTEKMSKNKMYVTPCKKTLKRLLRNMLLTLTCSD